MIVGPGGDDDGRDKLERLHDRLQEIQESLDHDPVIFAGAKPIAGLDWLIEAIGPAAREAKYRREERDRREGWKVSGPTRFGYLWLHKPCRHLWHHVDGDTPPRCPVCDKANERGGST